MTTIIKSESTDRARSTNMMLSDRYVPNWGTKEALREIVANAMDADPDYQIRFEKRGTVVVITTKTEPTITQVVLMGAGTKDASTDSIGQFGEGLKLAALVLTRNKNGLKIATSSGNMRFGFKKDKNLDEPTLHVTVNPRKVAASGCVITFHAAKVEKIYKENFLHRLDSTTYGAIPKEPKDKGCKVFCRGILVRELEDKSVHHWNLSEVSMNRDRNLPDMWDLKYQVARAMTGMIRRGNEQLVEDVLTNPNSLEGQCWGACSVRSDTAEVFGRVFRRLYGSDAVLSSGHEGIHNSLAAARGHEVIALPEEISNVLQEGGVKLSNEVLLRSDHLTQVPGAGKKYKKELDELATLLDVIGCGATSFHVFKDNGTEAGAYDKHGVWLNIKLFSAGQRFERIRTMLHEMGHAKGGHDESLTFENSLDFIAGKLGEAILNRM